MTTNNSKAFGSVYNIENGTSVTILELFNIINSLIGKDNQVQFSSKSICDITRSVANINHSKNELGYYPTINLKEGLNKLIEYWKSIIKKNTR